MSQLLRTAGLAALATASLIAGVSIATAQQPTGRTVSFGDSLSDPGNLFALTGQPPAPYYQGHFSNGITWIETLDGGKVNGIGPVSGGNTSGNVDLAFGGAFTGTGNLGGPALNGTGIQSQISTFFGAGGKLAPNDLVTMWGGANNIFQFFNTTPNPTQAQIVGNSISAATTMLGDVQTVAANGGRNILVVNLPDIGATPSFNGNALTSQAGTLAATS